jgi:hypothetical protein
MLQRVQTERNERLLHNPAKSRDKSSALLARTRTSILALAVTASATSRKFKLLKYRIKSTYGTFISLWWWGCHFSV